MRTKPLLFTILIAATLVLTACTAAPLRAKDATVTLGVSSSSDVVVGDKLTVKATAKLLHGRTDPTKLLLQDRNGGDWKTIASKKIGKSTTDLSAIVEMKNSTKYDFRSVVLTATKPSRTVTSTAVSTVTPIDLKGAIRTLYYNESQAYSQSTSAGIAFDIANDYPGIAMPTNSVWKKNVAEFISAKFSETDVPDLTTVSPAPTWTMPKTTCSAAATTPPKGRTYIVTLSTSASQLGFATDNSKADAHVTLLDGKVYFFEDFCL